MVPSGAKGWCCFGPTKSSIATEEVQPEAVQPAMIRKSSRCLFFKAQHGLTHFLGAIAFGQELLLFHLHSTDHAGPEGQFHLLFQLIILVALIATLIGIGFPNSFMGCWMNYEEAHYVVRCDGEASLHRAKSLANLLFSYFADEEEKESTDDVESQKKSKINESYKSLGRFELLPR
ncbi:hypothetical protein TIFTF001_034179 [Ficus carica]|uniref:Uncharacterized protein n=1 Tax=Ficus carica TaxID=3494 RepID=A0AA88DZD4_FICCA|nr:hypothetical protein TIFTF001_034179 [Ficus carica]